MRLMLNDVCKSFDDKIILKDVNFTFEKGKIYGLLGKNGAGKTTLFNCIARQMGIDHGEMMINDAPYDSRSIGYVYSTPRLPIFMTGYEFVKYFSEVNKYQIPSPKRPEDYLNLVGIDPEDHHKLLRDYSHGMQNKVQMLISLIVQPPILLLDEPLTSFDVVAAHEMKELLLSLKSESIIIFSTHILQLAQDLCDEIVLLHNQVLRGIADDVFRTSSFEDEVIRLLSEDGEN